MRFIGTFIILFALWILFSGHFDSIHLVLGVISSLIVTFIMAPVMFPSFGTVRIVKYSLRFLAYLPWLTGQIFMANIDIVYRVLHPKMPINPRTITFSTGLRTDIGKLVLGNSITLTPGTITMNIEGAKFTVHAIADESAKSLLNGEMRKRVEELERP